MKLLSGNPEAPHPLARAHERPEITVVIPVWNGQDHLGHCLRALEAQTIPRQVFEIIVVDNGSTDGTVAVAERFAGVRVISEPTPGSYAARNAGLAQANGALVAFTDADCRPAPNWLSEALSACRDRPDVGLIGGRIELFSENSRPCLAELYEQTFAFRQSQTLKSGRCTTANWISPRAVLEGLGGFDGELKSGGDYDLSLRIAAAGHPVAYAETMVVRHPVRATLAALSSKRRRTVGGRWAMRSGLFKTAKLMVRGFANTADALKQLVASRNLSLTQTFGVAGVIAVLAAVEINELIRLACGKPPNRA